MRRQAHVRPILVAATVLAAGLDTPAFCQAGGTTDLRRDRVGTEAAPPPLPPFAQPAPAAPPAPPVMAAPAPAGDLLIRDVSVTGGEDAAGWRAKRQWLPRADASSMRLVHRPAEMLDVAWVRRQFAENGMIGARVGYDRIAELLQLINVAYVQNGFINSGLILMPQPAGAADGILRLRLVAGHLVDPAGGEPVAVGFKDGHGKGLDAAYIRHRMPATAESPLNISRIERDFRLLADDPAIRTINADLRPGTRAGEASLVVTVDPQPRVDLYTGFSNSRSPSVGGNRVSGGGYVRSALRPGDLLSAEVGSTSGLTDVAASYSVPLARGTGLLVRGGFDDAAVIDRPLRPLDISSREWSIEGGVNQSVLARPLVPREEAGGWSPAQSLVLGTLVAHRRLVSKLLGMPFSFSPGSDAGRTEYSALRLTADYTRRSLASVLAVSFTGLVGLGGTRPDDRSVPHPSTHFTAAIVQVNYARRLNPRQLELRLRFAGQAAGGLLYSPERFSLGGVDTVRGYRENLLLADEAAVGSAELAQPFSLKRGGNGERPDWTAFTISAFADGGIAHNRVSPQPQPERIASVGVGTTWTPAAWLFARVSYARALYHVGTPGRRDLQDRGFAFRVVFHPLPLLFGRRL